MQEKDPGQQETPRLVRGGVNRTLTFVIIAMLAGYFLSGWGRKWLRDNKESERHFDTMNTYGRIRVLPGDTLQDSPAKLAEVAEEVVKRVAELMSPVGDTSDVVRLNNAKAGEWVSVNPMTWHVVMEALRWHRLSGGAFDPTIGPVKQLFRFEQSEAIAWPSAAALSAAQERMGAEKLLFDREGMRLAWAREGMRLDLGAIAKGFSADLAAKTLQQNGVTRGLVDIGGELRLIGQREDGPDGTWRTGIKSPRNDRIVEKLALADAAVATSGDYERFFTYKGIRYQHIIDPRVGLPMTRGPASVTVIHPSSCLAADALATTLCVLGPEKGKEFIEKQALSLFAQGGVKVVILTQSDADKQDTTAKEDWRKITITVNEEGKTTYHDEPVNIEESQRDE